MIEDLALIRNFNILKTRENIICGSKEYVRKASKLLARADIQIKKIYCDESILDDELQGIERVAFSGIFSLKEKEQYNIIYGEKDQEILDENLKQLNDGEGGHIYTYCGLYITFAINAVKEESMISQEMICMNELNAAMGTYDLAARWLRGIRWVEESGINLLLYIMPKTGSQSMKATLNLYGFEHTYIHFLNLYSFLDKQFYNYYKEKIPCLAELIQNPEQIKHHYLNFIKNKKLKIITSVREPIARNYSMIFQAIKNWGPYPLVSSSEGDFERGIIDYLNYCCDSTWEWFDDEIKKVFDIDVFRYPFDKEKGYTVIKKDNIEIFLYKLEASKHLGEALGEFLGAEESIDMHVRHETDKEEFRFIYNQLKEELHIPDNILSRNYSNDKMLHFYTEEEISGFINNWK